jgi:invasion protein IalB
VPPAAQITLAQNRGIVCQASLKHGIVKIRGLFLMTYRTAAVAAKALAFITPATMALALAGAPHAFAQQPSTNPPTPPLQQGAPAETAQNGAQVELIASPWTKYCATGLTTKSSEITTKGVCFTASDAHLKSGEKIVIALLIEPENGDKKLFRVTLPFGVALVPGARIVIDEKDAVIAPYVVCEPKAGGCIADYQADADLIAKLKNGRSLAIQAVDKAKPVSFTLPLTEFAKAYDGPPSDPAGLEHPGTPGSK